jgi:hypothetical protein
MTEMANGGRATIPNRRRSPLDNHPPLASYLTTAAPKRGVDIADAHTDAWWRSCCDAGIEYLASTGVVFQAADLADLGVPDPSSGKFWGPRFHAAARHGLIELVGYAPSKRPTCAGSLVRLWRGAGR